MAWTKKALIRYRTIDRCLQNHQRKWSLNDLREACSDALHELEGRPVDISKRTTQLDLQIMRSEKLGYEAPIEVYQKKYYRYADPDYKISDIPLNEGDLNVITESIEILKQFKDFSLFRDLNGVFQKLEDQIHQNEQRASLIHFDKNERLRGLNYLDEIYQAILKGIVLDIRYQSYRNSNVQRFKFHAIFLKEYNNRWFVIGHKNDSKRVFNFALDRIQGMEADLKSTYQRLNLDPDEFYKDTFGVTVLSPKDLIEIELWVNPSNAPYVISKRIHASQKTIQEYPDGSVIISIRVHHNFEIERHLFGFADNIRVLKPERLVKRIKHKLEMAAKQYDKEFHLYREKQSIT
ncbi:MAG: WYL domain-containing protein [Bacteroidetes bacterium]|nr:WYL domain-containing protein [Bacteroidota bacterium]